MNAERTLANRTLMLLCVLTLIGSAFRLLPYYWSEEHKGWLLCLWGANAILPLFLAGVSKSRYLWLGYAIPLAGLVISDLIIQVILQSRQLPTSSLTGRLATYSLFLALAQLGLVFRWFKLSRFKTIMTGIGLSLTGSILFFLISNFLVWTQSTPAAGTFYYPPTWAGLIRCYEMGLPFFKNQFSSDGIFALVFFSIFALLESQIFNQASKPSVAKANAVR